MTTYTLTEAQRQQLLDVCLAGVSTANTLATQLLQSLAPQAAPSTSPEPVYQYQLVNGNWIDQHKEMYDYIATFGQATVRELFTHPAPSTSPAVVRVCPDKNSVCGYNSRYWCNSCPKHTDAAPSTSPLTDDQMWAIWNSNGSDEMNQREAMAFARAIEAAHGIKEDK